MSGLGINPNLLIAQIVNFVLVALILRAVLYRPMARLFAERRERIQQGLEAADRARAEADAERARFQDALAAERRTSQEKLREAVARSEQETRRRLDEAHAEADRILAEARADAERTRAEALAGLHDEIAGIALAASAKALGEGIDEATHRRLIERFLAEQLAGPA